MMREFFYDISHLNVQEAATLFSIFFGFVVIIGGLWIRFSYVEIRRKARKLEAELQKKNDDLQKVIEDLKTTQVRLIESGKVSAAAALSAGILHQISQPITAIHGFVRFMKQEMPADNPFYRPVCLMDEQSIYLKDMLDNLMTVIRHRKIEKMSVAVNHVIEKSINLLVDELRIRRILWEVSYEQSLPQIYADPIHLQQVFMNIIVNASEALTLLPRGQERRLLVVTEFDAVNRNAKIIFKDNGPGIPQDIKPSVFEPFFSTKPGGSGIGLALCHDLITEHGGTIDLESDSRGTAISIALPVTLKEEKESHAQSH